jgi:hypothetical protein
MLAQINIVPFLLYFWLKRNNLFPFASVFDEKGTTHLYFFWFSRYNPEHSFLHKKRKPPVQLEASKVQDYCYR